MLKLPRLLGALVWAVQLHKGAGHKYIRRVPTGDPKRPWRYYYTVAGGHGLGHEAELKVGAAFRVKHQGKDGHFHIVGEEGGKLRIRHDETGHEELVSREALAALLRSEHAEAIGAHRAKLKRELEAVKIHGSDKQKARLEAEAKRAGVVPEPPPLTLEPPPAKPKRGSRRTKDEILAARGADGRTVTAQIEKDERDWGAKIGGARKDIWDIITTRNIAQLEAEDPDLAFKLVTKDRVFPAHNPEQDHALGLTPGASLLKKEILKHVALRPENSPGHRAAYIAAAEWLPKMLDRCKTVAQTEAFLELWKHMILHKEAPVGELSWDEFRDKVGATPASDTQERDYRSKVLIGPDGERYIYSADRAEALGFTRTSQQNGGDRTRGQAGAYWGQPVSLFAKTPDVKMVSEYAAAMGIAFAKQLTDRTKDKRAVLWRRIYEARMVEAKGDWSVFAAKSVERAKPAGPRSDGGWKLGIDESTRVGGPEVPEQISEDDLVREFGLNRGEYGRSVDAGRSDAHARNAYAAFVDLADILGVERKQLTNGGQLGIAFGARGRGGARAHYEASKKVINITKMASGSLAHEWGHFLDHILSPEQYVSEGRQIRSTMGSHGEVRPLLPAGTTEALQRVMDVIKHGPTADAAVRKREAEAKLQALHRAQVGYSYEAVLAGQEVVKASKEMKQSAYLTAATNLGDYWARPHELFARAFESFVEDELAARGRRSDYLVNGTRGAKLRNEPYPQGAERAAINEAMRALVRTMGPEVLKKALKAWMGLKPVRFVWRAA